MWLINTETGDLEFVQNPAKGSYAILSHTWGPHEISFQQYPGVASPGHVLDDVVGGVLGDVRGDEGLDKINMTCRLARARNLNYAWVDTCCIDKSSSAELSEAINSMFKWYRDAAVCFVFLSDLEPLVDFRRGFSACRWLKRGWTLQELIAPRHVEFYDREWILRSTKDESRRLIEAASGVDYEVLEDSGAMARFPVAKSSHQRPCFYD